MPLVVDATQYLGAGGDLNVTKIKPAFVACSVHKWLLCPYGASLLYASKHWQAVGSALEQHDRCRAGADDVECLSMDNNGKYPMEFIPGARRFDSGGRPNYVTLPMMEKALELIQELTVERIVATLRPMTARIARGARELVRHGHHKTIHCMVIGFRSPRGACRQYRRD